MTPRISTPAKTLGIAALLGLAFWVGLFAAIEKYGLGTVVTWGVGIVAILGFLGLVRDVFAAAKDARRNALPPTDDLSWRRLVNEMEQRRKTGGAA